MLLLSKTVSKQLTLDVQHANKQYGGFELKAFTKNHDRILIIDNQEVYYLGASSKDSGKKLFAFSKMDKDSVKKYYKLNFGIDMKEGWETKTLGEICKMYQPKTISKKEMVVGEPYPVFGANGIIGNFDKYKHEEAQLLITCTGQKYLKNKMPIVFGSMERTAYLGTIIFQPMGAG